MARPRRAEAPSEPVRIRLSPWERQRFTLAARVNHQNLSQFARDAIVTATEDCLESSVSISPTKRSRQS